MRMGYWQPTIAVELEHDNQKNYYAITTKDFPFNSNERSQPSCRKPRQEHNEYGSKWSGQYDLIICFE